MQCERVFGFHHLREADLHVPTGSNIFLDPADTEVGAWVGSDLIEPGCTVMDLGSGSGACAAAFVRSGAAQVLGVDISPDSVAWAKEHYGSAVNQRGLNFALADFIAASTEDLIGEVPGKKRPDVVTSNPAYVPLPEEGGAALKSIYGGPDGLKFVPPVLRHAVNLNARLGLTIGSYSSPRRAAQLLAQAGYGIRKITLAALALGDSSRNNPERIYELKEQDEAVLWHRANVTGYLIVGLSCSREPEPKAISPDQLMHLLSCACSSATDQLESLSDFVLPELPDISVRVLVLPDPAERKHW